MSAYERFVTEERLNAGGYRLVGTDLDDTGQIEVSSRSGRLRAWGVRRPDRALLWIDNAAHTWKNVFDGVPIPPASATLTISGFRPRVEYSLEWWDPYAYEPAEQVTRTQPVVARPDGTIRLQIADLTSDIAVKIIATQALWEGSLAEWPRHAPRIR